MKRYIAELAEYGAGVAMCVAHAIIGHCLARTPTTYLERVGRAFYSDMQRLVVEELRRRPMAEAVRTTFAAVGNCQCDECNARRG